MLYLILIDFLMFDPFVNVRNIPDHSAVSSRQDPTQSDGRTKASNALPDSWANVPIFGAVTSDHSRSDSCCYLSGSHGTSQTCSNLHGCQTQSRANRNNHAPNPLNNFPPNRKCSRCRHSQVLPPAPQNESQRYWKRPRLLWKNRMSNQESKRETMTLSKLPWQKKTHRPDKFWWWRLGVSIPGVHSTSTCQHPVPSNCGRRPWWRWFLLQ